MLCYFSGLYIGFPEFYLKYVSLDTVSSVVFCYTVRLHQYQNLPILQAPASTSTDTD